MLFSASVSTLSVEAQDATEISEEERERDARALFALASRHYETGRLTESIEEYRRAYALFPLPALQFNLYLAHRDAGNLAEAAAALRLYLDSDDTIEDARRSTLERRLSLTEANVAAMNAEPEEPEPNATADLQVDLQVDPGEGESSGGVSPAVGGVFLGVGGALLIGALIEGLVANGKNSDLDEICGADNLCPAAQQADIVASFETHRNVAWGLLYSGAAVAVTGTVLLLLSGGDGDEDQPVANLECGPVGCTGSFQGTF